MLSVDIRHTSLETYSESDQKKMVATRTREVQELSLFLSLSLSLSLTFALTVCGLGAVRMNYFTG